MSAVRCLRCGVLRDGVSPYALCDSCASEHPPLSYDAPCINVPNPEDRAVLYPGVCRWCRTAVPTKVDAPKEWIE